MIHTISDIGIIHITFKHIKRLHLTVKPFDGICISAPQRTSLRTIERFVRSNQSWIAARQTECDTIENSSTIFDETTAFTTAQHTLRVVPADCTTPRTRICNGTIHCTYPKHMHVKSYVIQKCIRSGIERALRKEAKVLLPPRAEQFAAVHDFQFKSIGIYAARTRWGSSSSTGRIHLNCHLMRLPQEIQDYVILHELAHTKVPNHSKRFWALLERICPHARALDKQLKTYEIEHY